jgi:hypothetical protein
MGYRWQQHGTHASEIGVIIIIIIMLPNQAIASTPSAEIGVCVCAPVQA